MDVVTARTTSQLTRAAREPIATAATTATASLATAFSAAAISAAAFSAAASAAIAAAAANTTAALAAALATAITSVHLRRVGDGSSELNCRHQLRLLQVHELRGASGQ